METRLAIQNIVNSDHVHEKDIVMIRNLLNKNSWNTMQENYARTIVRKYGYKIERKKEVQKELPKRRAVLRDDRIFIFGEFSGDANKKDRIKFGDIPGREYHPDWSVPCNNYSIKILRELGCHLSQNLIEWEEENNRGVEREDNLDFDERLYPYQKEGVVRLEELKGRALLSDVVGLGKTAQVATYIVRNMGNEPVLIICPSGLRLNWERELRLWGYKGKIKVINGKKDTLSETGITILSYNVAFNYYGECEEIGFKLLCADESQALIHETSKRTKAVKYLSKGIEKIIMITATPLTSRPKNMFVQLNIISPEMFNNRTKFIDRYCNGQKDSSGNGCSRPEELHEILSKTFLIRRTKEQVLEQLPSKMYQAIPIEINKEYRDKYEYAKKDLIGYIKENYGNAAANRARFGETMVKMEHLKQIAVEAKLEESIEYINTIIDSGEPVVLFVTHKFVVERLMEVFGNIALKIDGSLSVKQKQANVDRFQTDKNIMVMVCNIEAGSTGITLTKANHCVFIQFPWTPHSLIQGFGRIDRVGQKSKVLNFHYIVADNTIDQTICNILDKKARIIGEIMDGDPTIEEGILLNELIEQFKNM